MIADEVYYTSAADEHSLDEHNLDEQRGPVSQDDLLTLIREKQISKESTLIWYEGLEDWMGLKDCELGRSLLANLIKQQVQMVKADTQRPTAVSKINNFSGKLSPPQPPKLSRIASKDRKTIAPEVSEGDKCIGRNLNERTSSQSIAYSHSLMIPSVFSPVPPADENAIFKSIRSVRFFLIKHFFRPSFIPSHIWVFGNRSYIEIALMIIFLAVTFVVCIGGGEETSGSIAEILGVIVIVFALRNSILNVVLGISFERAIFWHRLAGCLFILASCIHGYANLWGRGGDDRRKLEDEEDEGDEDGGGRNLTGIILVSFLIAIGASYLIRNIHFELFYYAHIALYCGTLPLALLHGARKFFFVLFLWLFDLLLRYIIASIKCSAEVTEMPDNIVRVTVLDKNFKYAPGQFCFIMCPALNRFEFHPFTISSSPHEKNVTFHIKATGDWTRGLLEIASSKAASNVEEGHVANSSNRDSGGFELKLVGNSYTNANDPSNINSTSSASQAVDMYLEGPFGVPTIDIMGDSYKVLLLICGGIGVTPCHSILKYLLYQKKHSNRGLKKVIFIWSSRNLDTFRSIDLPLSNLSSDINSTDDVAHFELYLTSKSIQVTAHEFGSSLVVGKRPEISKILAKTAEFAYKNGENRVGVVTCGPTAMIHEVEDSCKSSSWLADKETVSVSFDVHSEVFDL